jgi:hypothetical protein
VSTRVGVVAPRWRRFEHLLQGQASMRPRAGARRAPNWTRQATFIDLCKWFLPHDLRGRRRRE